MVYHSARRQSPKQVIR